MCVFCDIVAGSASAAVVLEDERCLAFLDARPLFVGHCLLVPKEHYETLPDLPRELVDDLFGNARLLAAAVPAAMDAEGSFVAINNKVSQSVPHLHVHVVPRRRRDGLRGFFWPRKRYSNEVEMEETAAAIRRTIELVGRRP